MTKMVLYPEVYLELQREIHRHTRLQQILSKHAPDDFVMRMMEIASYAGVGVPEQEMDEQDFIKLARLCVDRMKQVKNPEQEHTSAGIIPVTAEDFSKFLEEKDYERKH